MPAMLGAATEVPPTNPASSSAPVLLISQIPSLQNNVASWPEAAFSERSGVKRCGTPEIIGAGFCIWPTLAVPVAVVPPPGAAPNATAGAEVHPNPWKWEVYPVKVIAVTEPPEMVVVATGSAVHPPPVNVMVGAEV